MKTLKLRPKLPSKKRSFSAAVKPWLLLLIVVAGAVAVAVGPRALILNRVTSQHASLQAQLAQNGIVVGFESIELSPWYEVIVHGLHVSSPKASFHSEQATLNPNYLAILLPKVFGANAEQPKNLVRSAKFLRSTVEVFSANDDPPNSNNNKTLRQTAEQWLEALHQWQSPERIAAINQALGVVYCPYIELEGLQVKARSKTFDLKGLVVQLAPKSSAVEFNLKATVKKRVVAALKGEWHPKEARSAGRLLLVRSGKTNDYAFDLGLRSGVDASALSLGVTNQTQPKSPTSLRLSYRKGAGSSPKTSSHAHHVEVEGSLKAIANAFPKKPESPSFLGAFAGNTMYADLLQSLLHPGNQPFWGSSTWLAGTANPNPIRFSATYEPDNPTTNLKFSLQQTSLNAPFSRTIFLGSYDAQRKVLGFGYKQSRRSGLSGTLRFVRSNFAQARVEFKHFWPNKRVDRFDPKQSLNGLVKVFVKPNGARFDFGSLRYKGVLFREAVATLALQRDAQGKPSGLHIKGSADGRSLRFEYEATHAPTASDPSEHRFQLQLHRHSFGVLASLLNLKELENEFISGEITFEHKKDVLVGSLNLQVEDLVTGKKSMGIQVDLNNKNLVVRDSFVRYKALSCEAINLHYSGDDEPNVFLALRLNGKSMAMQFDRIKHNKSYSVFESTKKNLQIRYTRATQNLNISADNTYLSLLERTLSGSVRYSLGSRDGEGWLRLTNPHSREPNLVRVFFDIKGNTIIANNLSYRDKTKVLKGSGNLLFNQGITYSMTLKDPSSEGFLSLSGKAIGGGLETSIVAKQVPLAAWFPRRKFYLNGQLRAQIELIGDPFNPDILFKGYINDYRHFTRLYTIYTDAYRLKGAWHLNTLNVYPNRSPANTNPMVKVVQSQEKSSVKNFNIQVNTFQSLQQLSGEFFASYNPRTKQGFLSSPKYQWNHQEQRHLYTFFAVQEGRIVLRSPQKNGVEGVLPTSRDGGQIDLRYLINKKERFVALGHYQPGELELELFSDTFQAKNLNFLIPSLVESEKPTPKTFPFNDERLQNQALNLYLKLRSANKKTILNGYAKSEGRVKLQRVNGNARYLLDLSIEDNVVHLSQCHLDYEEAWMSAEGTIKLNDNLSINHIDIELKTSEDRGVLVDTQIERLHYRGRVLGTVDLSGNLDLPQISGLLTLKNGDLQLDSFGGTSTLNPSSPSGKNFFTHADYNLLLQTKGRSVQFESDILSFPIKQGEQLTVKGNFSRGDHTLSGNIKGKENAGTFTYQGIDFQLKRVEVYYAGDVGSLVPIATLRATLKRKDYQNNQPIEVILETSSDLVQGGDYRLSSVPSKSKSEIESILGLQNTEEQPNSYQDYFVDKASRVVMSRIVLNPIERSARRMFNLDLFQIDTDLYKLLTQTPNLEEEENAVNVSFTMGKYLGYNFFLRFDTELEFKNTVPTQFESTTLGMEYFLFNYLNIQANYSLDPESKPETTFRVDKTWQF